MGCLWWSYVLTQPQNTATWLRTASEIDCLMGLSPIGGTCIDLPSHKKAQCSRWEWVLGSKPVNLAPWHSLTLHTMSCRVRKFATSYSMFANPLTNDPLNLEFIWNTEGLSWWELKQAHFCLKLLYIYSYIGTLKITNQQHRWFGWKQSATWN